VIEVLPDYRVVIRDAKAADAAGDLGELARFRGSSLVPCMWPGCYVAAVVAGERDRAAVMELIVDHGWAMRERRFVCVADAPA
jgi:hypothetical protein